jgi:DNA-binding beta-propeller fold protein YncE
MRRRPPISIGLAAAVAVGISTGCATPPGVVFDTSGNTRQWPPPPDSPRIRYVGSLSTDQDLRPGRSGFKNLGRAIFGKDPTLAMLSPLAVCTDDADRVFVADSNAQLVHVFDLRTREYARWAPAPEDRRLTQPVAVAYDPAGRLLVSDSVGGCIVAFDMDAKVQQRIGEGILQRPCGLVVDRAGGRIIVADAAAHQIVMLSLSGDLLATLGQRGTAPGEFNYPTNVALDRAGRLYVSDSMNFRVQVFGPDLEPLRQIGRKGDMPGYFAQPKGVAIDPDGHLYVVDANFEAVQIFDDEGQLLMTFGSEGHGPGEFWLPAGIHADSSGRIWVADSYNSRVQVFEYLREAQAP